MNPTHIDTAVSETCVNPYSYGEICVRCGCCGKNPNYRDMVIKQIRLYKERLCAKCAFDAWSADDHMAAIEKKNVEKDILYFRKKIRVLKKILKTTKKGRLNG